MNNLSKATVIRGTYLAVCVMTVMMLSMNVQALVTLTKEVTGLDANGYFVNGVTTTLTVTVTMNYDGTEGTITALGYEETIPAGFAYISGSASGPNVPAILPPTPTGTLQFGYIFVPSFPASFSYQVSCPSSICDPEQMVGKILYRTSGPQLESAPVTTIIELEPTSLSFTRELSGPGVAGVNRNFYVPGEDIYVTILIEKEGPQDITALGFQDTLPAGWTYQGLLEGSLPVVPEIGKTGLLEFSYVDIPTFPAEFTYIVNVPNTYSGIAVIGGEIIENSETKSSAVVYRTCGGPILSPKVETQLDGVVPCLLVSRTFTPNYYIAGQNVDVTINIRIDPDHPCVGAVSALGYQETIPTGWVYQSVGGTNPPAITPINPNGPVLDFGYIFVPNLSGSGASFTYTIKASESASGLQGFCGQAIYRLGGGELRSDVFCSEVIDDTPPVITLNGESEITIECGTEYLDEGATATDVPDGVLTEQIEVTNNVDTAEPGDYTVDYSVTDSSNNTTTAQRIVHVVDTTKPVITLNGANPLIVECKDTFTDPGATAVDSCDTNVTVNTSGTVNTNVVGDYTLTYTATDASGNSADPVTRIVRVLDTTKPVITLVGPNPYYLECHSVYLDPGATASDACQGTVPVTNDAATVVNANEPGDYEVTYTATDASGNTATTTRIVQVRDSQSPIVTIVGADPLTVQCGSVFNDPGATANDACDGILAVVASGNVNTNQVGSYTVTYTATDRAGKTGTATRTVNVVDTVAPQVTLVGGDEITHECGLEFTDPGATATDNCDTTLEVVISGWIYSDVVGDYTLIYTATDDANNSGSATRTIHVVDTTGPEIILNQDEMEIECGDVFEDPGAIAVDKCEGIIQQLTAAAIYLVDTIYGLYEVENIETSEVGQLYQVRYVAEDSSGNRSEKDMPVEIVDKTKPVITLNGDNPVVVECKGTFTDPGATATDSCDANVMVEVSGSVYTDIVGEYTLTYTATDASGNSADPVTRTVQVVDTGKPVITLLGASTMTVECKGTFTDPGATATDSCDATVVVNVTGTVNPDVVGEYTLTYTAVDSSGNSADPVTRTVQVVDTVKPEIVLNGANPLVVECKGTFTDPGATATDSCDANVVVNVTGTVNTNSVGNYTLTYTAVDVSGNSANPVTRTVQVVDTGKPVITLLGA
ncbi:MAG: DUF5011 domain-containing protein, partial [Candidatus Hydrogenedens sp.]|nr:DUF5011 domain-containing protein [Candidatus Hydrogenedens sp.]